MSRQRILWQGGIVREEDALDTPFAGFIGFRDRVIALLIRMKGYIMFVLECPDGAERDLD